MKFVDFEKVVTGETVYVNPEHVVAVEPVLSTIESCCITLTGGIALVVEGSHHRVRFRLESGGAS